MQSAIIEFRSEGTMYDDDGELVSVMLAIVFAAVILVAGELYIVKRSSELHAIFAPQQQLDHAP
jgi:hypothetical protein